MKTKLSDHITITADMVQAMIRDAKRMQESLHDERMSDKKRDFVDRILATRTQRIESLAVCLGMQVRWPGLYPQFEVEDRWYDSFIDALASTFGQPTFHILLKKEKEGWDRSEEVARLRAQVDSTDKAQRRAEGGHAQ